MGETSRRKTVLVVDDTEDIRELMRLQLATLGYRVAEASNGREAVEAAVRERPALILMDLTMPVLDGLAATRLIRETDGISHVVIVAFTALHSGEGMRRAIEAGCDDYVQKPISVIGLSDILTRYLPAGTFIKMSDYLARQMASLRHGDHTCLVYESEEEQVRAAAHFLAEGLCKGERSAFAGDGRAAGHVTAALRGVGVNTGRERERGALLYSTTGEAYLRAGWFDLEGQFRHLGGLVGQSLADGFTGLRHAGEMHWALGSEPGCDRLLEYEARLNDLVPKLSLTGMCQYDRRRFPAEVVRDALRAHPVVVLSDGVRPNHFYEPPELLLNGHSADSRVEWMMSGLRGEGAAEARPTIMVAEDDREISAGMRRALRAIGYRVVKAEDADELLDVGRRERPGLILTNTDLAWLDELIRLVRQDAELRFVPVAAVYADRPGDFRDDRLVVLDDYSRLEELFPTTAPDAS
jgi:CheY-like chemotaxis protein